MRTKVELKAKKGFTLIEAAMVLVIIGFLLGMGIGLYVTFVKWNKRRTTQDLIQKTADNLIGYAVSNGGTGFDLSQLPSSKDAYLQPLMFVISDKLSKSYLSSKSATICDVKNSGLSFKDENSNSTINNVAFVVFSRGEDYRSDTYCNSNKVNSNVFCSGTVKSDSTKDIYKVVTLDKLKQYLSCLRNPLKISPGQLPLGFAGKNYSATLTATGGIKLYKWCYSGSLPGGISINPSSVCPSYQQASEVKLSGTPSSAGNSKITVCVQDSNSPEPYSKCKEYAITINLLSGNGTSEGVGTSNCTQYNLVFSTVNMGKEWIWVYLNYTYNRGIGDESYDDLIPDGRSSHYQFTSTSEKKLTKIDLIRVHFSWSSKVYSPITGNAAELDKNGDCLLDIRCIVPPDYDGSDVSVVKCTSK